MPNSTNLFKKNFLWNSLWVVVILVPLIFFLRKIELGTFPFWYDPARDLLLAAANLKKITLIGPPSGIPGIFYGPYWIWALSFGLLLNQNPRSALFVVGIIPYFVFFPLILLKLRKILGNAATVSIWILFIFNFDHYATNIWNPYPAPLLTLAIIYLITTSDLKKNIKDNLIKICSIGMLAALLISVHLSFGVGITFATVLYLCIFDFIFRQKMSVKEYVSRIFKRIVIFSAGFLIILSPFILFEARHGFFQTKAVIHMITNSFLYNSAVVGQTGLTKDQIIPTFFVEFFKAFHFDGIALLIFSVFFVLVLMFTVLKSRKKMESHFTRLLTYLGIATLAILAEYFSSKNPIWEYHFIGVEIIMFLLLGFMMKKNLVIKIMICVWVIYIFLAGSIRYTRDFSPDVYKLTGSLGSSEHIVKKILQDARGRKFTYFAYSPAIYSYDFDYLFLWLGKMNTNDNLVYIIIPAHTTSAVSNDFISYKTPNKLYKTEKQMQFEDGSVVLERIKTSSMSSK